MYRQRVIIAEDHPILQEAIRDLLEPEFDVVCAVADGRTLLEIADRERPGAIVLDVSLPGLNGFEAARKLEQLIPSPRLIFYSMHGQADYVREAFNAGASAYVCKTSASAELSRAVREALRGRQFVCVPGAGPELLTPESKKLGSSLFRQLTPRQREVLQLVAEGKSAKMIAADLHISSKTVEFHKAAMLASLRLRSTAELIRYAVESGMVRSHLELSLNGMVIHTAEDSQITK